MELFPDRLVTDLERLPGASHTFLKQVCAPDQAPLRAGLSRAVQRMLDPHRERAASLLTSLDNRRFFQGYAEVATITALEGAGWELTRLHTPGARLEVRSPQGKPWMLAVLAFLHQVRPMGESSNRTALAESLSRVQGKHRFSVLIRRWLPHDFDPEPVRRAVETWLGQVAQDRWDGRYAAYEDDRIGLEFCLTGERVRRGEPLLAQILGPYLANRTLEAIEPRVVRELDRHNASTLRDTPVLLACVADQPWALTEGYTRDFLYGRPRAMVAGADEVAALYSPSGSVAVFRDPPYRNVGGMLLIDGQPGERTRVRTRAWLNPWADHPLRQRDVGVRAFAEDAATTSRYTAAWSEPLRALTWQGDRETLELV